MTKAKNSSIQTNQKILNIEGKDGRLFALETTPEDDFNHCIIMLNSGMLNRSGPQRLYWSFAQKACAAGLAVIRVDLAGVGDSLAEIHETHFDNHRKEDVDAVINYVKSKWPATKIILQGLCAGSRVSFKSAVNNEQVDGILAWSTEIYTASQNMPQSPHEPKDRLSDYEVSDTLSRTIKFLISFKFLRPSWWKKQYPNGEGFWQEVKHTIKCTIRAIMPKGSESQGEFLSAADGYLNQKRPVYFIFGENDERALNEFETRFPHIKKDQSLRQSYRVIKNGTHTFSTLDSAAELIQESISWIKRHF